MDERKLLNCILLVEDDSVTNFLNKKIIEKLHITESIIITQNGEEALQYIRKNTSPELILLDINMPIMNGLEFLKAFEMEDFKNKNSTKIIVLSSSESMVDQADIESHGIPFMNKPLSGELLLEIIYKIFQKV